MSMTSAREDFRQVVRKYLSAGAAGAGHGSGAAPDDVRGRWQEMTEQLGLAGLAVPEEYGGAGAEFADVLVAMEELGRVVHDGPFVSSAVLATLALVEAADGEAIEQYLPQLAEGTRTATLAWLDDGGDWNAVGGGVSAVSAGDGWTLDGHTAFVLDGAEADLLVVAATTKHGVGLFVVEAPVTGLDRQSVLGLDPLRYQARLTFQRVPARLLGQAGDGDAVVRRVLDQAACVVAAEQLGLAEACLEMTVEYAKVRHQFGRPIGSFQAVKHLCADMLMGVESAKALVEYVGDAVARGGEDLGLLACIARVHCSRVATEVAAATIQVHGGIGFTEDHRAHLYFKRAHSLGLLFGAPAEYLRRVADTVAN